jgi:hypothetical protein
VSARDVLRSFFLSHVGEILDSDTLRQTAGISEWARRVRELRNEEGFDIQTHNDRSDLKPGQYVLVSAKPLPSFSRGVSKETRAFVLDRDGFTCQMCGAVAGERHPYDGRIVRLHIGHILDKEKGGSDEVSNLRAVCSVCNEGLANVALQRPSARVLLSQIRRANNVDQLDVLKWLVKKYPDQARQMVEGEV